MPTDGLWFRVESSSTASAVRRAAERLGGELGLGETRVADLAIVATELATNLVKHADEGQLLLRPVRHADRVGVELVALDSGPGMADLVASARDGHSTAGTLGIGLGAVVRQASWYDGHSVPGRGTVLAVQIWSGPPPQPGWAAGVVRPLTGESVSGDGYAVRDCDDRYQLLVCDGLGHGVLAHAATQAALAAFRAAPALPPAALVERLHTAMAHTRGGALSVAEVDPVAGLVRYAGLGNVSASIVGYGTRRGLVSLPGIAGHNRRMVREYEYPFTADEVLVMQTDGVTDRWQLDNYPGLLERSPLVFAATVLRDAGVRRDDACVLVARVPR
ncbi:ATP-binding SpoIIE family protein phosphatase [Micromonospora echinofusca]|uniref:SpoIIE family protein phosphatase n=1 Tax=Micromonospora echinofusca TaxID=47858 RepID=A0ABS3VL38_MICEH|nr:ATP-binding SpoIIE family protein phosphatase [Micromonospora echinofusca]MBO4205158.1 SpoIIE family protein phosphatase [Micromonospora echinofusca]